MTTSYLIVTIIALLNVVSSTKNTDCDFYIAPSRVLKSGMGIFAGRKHVKDESQVSGVTVRYSGHETWQLAKYVFSTHDSEKAGICVVEFGPAMIYNHHVDNNVQHSFVDDWEDGYYEKIALPQITAYQLLEANTISPMNFFRLNYDILPGEEMFNSYGDTWFTSKGIELSTPSKQESSYPSMSELKAVGHCVSNIYTSKSKISAQESAGQGVFASVEFKKGELVDVSPVLVLPKHEVQEASDSSYVLINFCFSRPGSDLAFLPIGYGAVCNHGGKNANVAIEWHWWGGSYNESVLSISPAELLKSEFAQLYFSYRALRDIKKDEEILIDYGADWEADWNKYLQAKRDFKIFKEAVPLFRRSIDINEPMFPDNWYVDCVGATCGGMTLTVISHYMEAFEIYWENSLIMTVEQSPMKPSTITCYPGHTFVFKHNNQVIQEYTATDMNHQKVVVTGHMHNNQLTEEL